MTVEGRSNRTIFSMGAYFLVPQVLLSDGRSPEEIVQLYEILKTEYMVAGTVLIAIITNMQGKVSERLGAQNGILRKSLSKNVELWLGYENSQAQVLVPATCISKRFSRSSSEPYIARSSKYSCRVRRVH